MGLKSSYRQAKNQIYLLCIALPLLFFLCVLILPKHPASAMLRDGFWANKITSDSSFDVVYIGDSRVYRGIDPDIVDSIAQLKGLNFGFSSAGLSVDFVSNATKYLDKNKQKTIVVGLTTNAMLQSSMLNEHFNSIEKMDKVDLWLRSHVYKYLTFADAYQFSDFHKLYRNEKYFESYHLNSGFAASNKLPYDSLEALDAYRTQFASAVYDFNSQIKLLDFLVYLKANAYNVYVLRMPSTFQMNQLENESFDNALIEFQNQLNDFGIETIVLTNVTNLSSYDGSHLDAKSARKLSIGIGLWLKEKKNK